MFKNLFNQKQNNNNYNNQTSAYTYTSPIRANRTPVKIQRQTVQRSPLRNRPSDIRNLKSFLNTIPSKNNASPMRLKSPSKSPIKIQKAYQMPMRNGRGISPIKAKNTNQIRYISPSRISQRNYYEISDTRKGPQTWRAPSQIIGNHPSSVNKGCKQNSKLFTQLIKNIKSQGDDTQHTQQYIQRKIQVQNTNKGLKKQTSLFDHFNYNRVQSEIHFQTQTKIKQADNYIEIEQKSIVQIKQSDNIHHSFGVIPFIQSITPSKHRGTCEQGIEMTLKPSVVQSFRNQIILQKEDRNIYSIRQSLSDNDRVIQSANSSELQLNMSLTK